MMSQRKVTQDNKHTVHHVFLGRCPFLVFMAWNRLAISSLSSSLNISTYHQVIEPIILHLVTLILT
jgi:hypothetical protein